MWQITGNGLCTADNCENTVIKHKNNSEHLELNTRSVNPYTLPLISTANNIRLCLFYDTILSAIVKSAQLTVQKDPVAYPMFGRDVNVYSSIDPPYKNKIKTFGTQNCENSQLIFLEPDDNVPNIREIPEYYLHSIKIMTYKTEKSIKKQTTDITIRSGDSIFSPKKILLEYVSDIKLTPKDCKVFRRMRETTFDAYFNPDIVGKTCGLYRKIK